MNALGKVYWALCIGVLCFLGSCATSPPPKLDQGNPTDTSKTNKTTETSNGEQGTSVQMISSYTVACACPYGAAVGKAFKVRVALTEDTPTTVENVIMGGSENITYSPTHFQLTKGQLQFVTATVKNRGSGLAVVDGFGPKLGDFCEFAVNTGYQGQLRVTVSTLPYGKPQSLNIQIVDSNDKPLPAETPMSLEIRTADALISESSVPKPGQSAGGRISVAVPVGATTSFPFVVQSTSWTGRPVHLLATLTKNQNVFAQSVISLESEAVWWLPIVLAVLGALLFAVYRALQADDQTSLWKKMPQKLLVGCVAGVIAYLFADSDLLGLKLDPHVLRTYPLLGFLFSFLGIDVLLSKKFKPRG